MYFCIYFFPWAEASKNYRIYPSVMVTGIEVIAVRSYVMAMEDGMKKIKPDLRIILEIK